MKSLLISVSKQMMGVIFDAVFVSTHVFLLLYSGNPTIKNVVNCALAARIYMYHVPYNEEGDVFMDWARVTSDRLTFLSSTTVEFSKDMYDSSIAKTEFDVKIKLGYMGTSSVAMITELYAGDKYVGISYSS